MELGREWISWRRNVPMTSNMEGVRERKIRSPRNKLKLDSLLRTHGESLNDESLRTLLAEVEGNLNSKTITCESFGDMNSYLLLSPMQLLTMKTKVVMPTPETFQKEDLYCRKQWRRARHLCDVFWTR